MSSHGHHRSVDACSLPCCGYDREVYVARATVAGIESVAAQAGLRVAPWPRVYADLRAVGVRGEEAVEHLREMVRSQ